MDDLQGLTNSQADEYIFGQYQQAKKRWRRFTGKPVRSLRRVLKRKGKGKGKRNSYLNIDSLLQQSAYFKGKGKGGTSSGKGFGRQQNPCGRDGEALRCSTCDHLRARCPRRTEHNSGQASSSSQPQRAAPAFTVEPASAGMHFAAFESDSSWVPITPRSMTSSRPEQRTGAGPSVPPSAAPSAVPQDAASVASARAPNATPDPWTQDPDPWMQWLHDNEASQAEEGAPTLGDRWVVPGLGDVGPRTSFSDSLGVGPRVPPPSLPAMHSASSAPLAPGWFGETQQAFAQVHAATQARLV